MRGTPNESPPRADSMPSCAAAVNNPPHRQHTTHHAATDSRRCETPLKAVFFATPALALHTLERCIAAGIDIPIIVTRPPRRAGRGKRVQASPVADFAAENSIPTFAPAKLDADAESAIREAQPDVAIAVAYGRLIPDSILDIPTHGTVNLHPSLLPRHRGPSPVQSAILQGDVHTGVTIMLLDSGMDTGPILQQSEPIPIADDTRTDNLSETLFQLGGDMLPEVVKQWCAGKITATAQNESHATVSKLIAKSDGTIDWNEDAHTVLTKNRAYQPWPGTATTWDGINLKIIEFELALEPTTDANRAPGTVWLDDTSKLRITAGDELAVSPTQIQLAGRSAVSAQDFLRGRPDIIGARLGA